MITMRSRSRMAAIVALRSLVGGTVSLPAVRRTPESKTEEQKTIYALGLAVAGSLANFALTPAELELVKAGLTDGVLNRNRQVDLQAYGTKIQELQQAAGIAAAAASRRPAKPSSTRRPRRRARRRRRQVS